MPWAARQIKKQTINIAANQIIDESMNQTNHGCRHVEASSDAMGRQAGRNTSTSRPRNPRKPEEEHF